MKCPNCNQETRKDLGRCHYCNKELPKGIFHKFFTNVSRLANQAKAGAELKTTLEKMGKGIEIASERGFRMTDGDIFFIKGRGVVVTGKIQSGTVSVGDTVVLVSKTGERISCVVKGIETFRKLLQEAKVGDNVGLLISRNK